MSDTPNAPKTIDDMRVTPRPQVTRGRLPNDMYGGDAPEAKLPTIAVGFGNLQSFEFTQRVARALASSSLVPEQYRAMVPNKRKRGEFIENPNAIPNCIVALNMADRLRTDVLTVMQSLNVIEGRPAWASQFVIATINGSGLFGRLKYRFEVRGPKTVNYEFSEWVEEAGSKQRKTMPVQINDVACTAFATDPSGEQIDGPEVSIAMAVQEGWYTRPGSKWKTMPDIMLRYRAAAFFSRTNAPELTMGLRTMEEEGDIVDVTRGPDDVWVTSQAEPQQGNSDGDTPTQQDAITHEQTLESVGINLTSKPAETVTNHSEDAPPPAKTAPPPQERQTVGTAPAERRTASTPTLDLSPPQSGWWTNLGLTPGAAKICRQSGVRTLEEAFTKPGAFWVTQPGCGEAMASRIMDALAATHKKKEAEKLITGAEAKLDEEPAQATNGAPPATRPVQPAQSARWAPEPDDHSWGDPE